MASIDVIFDHSDHKYNPGEIIKLEIRVDVTTDTTIRRIYAKLHGFAHVEFKAHAINPSHETYFKHYKTLIGSKEGPDTRLIAGSHMFYASYLLPQYLPENFEGCSGHIRYEAKIQMVMAYNLDKKEKLSFFIKPRCDLNRFQRLGEPLRIEAKRRFGSFCWKSDPLYMYNVLPRRGFIPGECVQYTIELNNNSDVSITSATVKLIEKIVYRAQSLQLSRERCRTLWTHTFTHCNDQLVAPMQKKVFSTDLYFNPDWCFHFFDQSLIINVEYNIISEANTDIRYPNLINSSKIYMGTIAFVNFRNNPMWFQPAMPFQSPMSLQSPMYFQSPMLYQPPTPFRFPMPSQSSLRYQPPSYLQSSMPPEVSTTVRQADRFVEEQPLPSYEEATK